VSDGAQQQLQALSQELQAIEEEITELEATIEAYRQEKREIDGAIDAIERLETGSTVQVPLGGGAHVRATVEDIDELVVSVGGGYAVEDEQEAAIAALERKQEALDDRIAETTDQLDELREEGSELEEQAQRMQQQLQQQQLGGLGDE
jgi:prefoldin alpha subunit